MLETRDTGTKLQTLSQITIVQSLMYEFYSCRLVKLFKFFYHQENQLSESAESSAEVLEAENYVRRTVVRVRIKKRC